MPMRVNAPGEVPSTFAPSVSLNETPISPANSPWVSPMRNSAPGQLQQLGSTLIQQGDMEAKLGNTIGDRVQETMDDAQTKAAENQFLQAALPALGQYKTTEGINATNQFDPAAQAITKARQDARASLTNPIQQHMFDQVTNDHMLTFGNQMAEHESVQRVQYGKDQSKARAGSLNTMSTLDVAGRNRDDSNFARFGAQSDAEVLNYAGLSGIAPDSPQADQMLRENRTSRYRSVVTSLLDQHAYNEASDFFDAHKGEMDIKQAEVLGNAVKSASLQVQGIDLGNQAVQSLHRATETMAVANPKGLVEPGNLPIWNRPIVKNSDGTVSSEYSTSFQDEHGHEVLVPTVVNGKFLTSDGKKPPEGSAAEKTMFQAAWNHYQDSGENLGKFDSPDDADAYAQILHNRGPRPTTLGAGPLSFPIPAGTISTTPGVDGIDIHAAPGASVYAPANGTVTKVWMDPQMGRSAQIALPSGYTATFNGLAAVNYQEGQKITAGQALGLTGKDDTGQGVMHYAMTDPNGQYVDPRQAASAPFDPKNFSAPEDEAKAVDYLNANVSDEVLRRVAVNRVESLANHNREIENQQHADAVKQAMNYAVQHGGSIAGLPTDVAGQLTPVDIDNFSQQTKAKNDAALMMNWAEHPEQQTVNAVKLAWQQGRLSDSSAPIAMRDALKMQLDANTPDPEKVRSVSVDHDQLTDILSLNNLPAIAQPDTVSAGTRRESAQLQRVQLETAIKNEIDLQQTNLKRELNWQEKQKIMRDMIIDKVYTSGNSASSLTPAAILTPDQQKQAHVWVGNQQVRMMDIPPQYAVQATRDLQSIGFPSTQANIAAWWLKKGMPKQ